MREGEYEYIHEFKERINEILFLQKKHHQIVMRNEDNPQIQQTSLEELHRLSVTLSNLYDVAPTIVGVGKDAPYQLHQKLRAAQQQTSSSSSLSVLRGLPFRI
jgi:CHAD domain-containing protein